MAPFPDSLTTAVLDRAQHAGLGDSPLDVLGVLKDGVSDLIRSLDDVALDLKAVTNEVDGEMVGSTSAAIVAVVGAQLATLETAIRRAHYNAECRDQGYADYPEWDR